MARFHSLDVVDVRRETRDAVVVTLKPRDEDAALFDFTQGQYLTFRRKFEDDELRRSYSICAGRGDGFLQVGIKRVDGGAFSTWANEELKAGATLDAMPPMGRFFTALEPDAAKNYLASLGVDPARITTISYGKERPAALGSDEAAWAQNRRAVTVTVQ